MKKNISLTIGIILLALSTIFLGYVYSNSDHGFSVAEEIRSTDGLYAENYGNDRILVDTSDYIFVGKVLKQKSVTDYYGTPATHFEVEVVLPIKGDLQKIEEVRQIGGYRDGVLYARGHHDSYPGNDTEYLLHPGSTYLIASLGREDGGWIRINSHPNARKLLSKDDFGATELRALAEEDLKVQELRRITEESEN